MRTKVQNKIYDVCSKGTFPKVTYDSSTKVATKSTTENLVPVVVVNEISGSPSGSLVHGSRDGTLGMSNWRFEARLKFTSEVDTYFFLTQELKSVTFTDENTRIKIASVGVPVVHPPRQGSHNGTEMVLTFSVTPKR